MMDKQDAGGGLMKTPLHMKVYWAASAADRGKGLLFDPPKEGGVALFPCKDVHTFGMRHAIDVAFVDGRGRVLEAHRSVRPLRRMRNRKAAIVVERIARADEPWFSVGDCLALSICRQDHDRLEGEG